MCTLGQISTRIKSKSKRQLPKVDLTPADFQMAIFLFRLRLRHAISSSNSFTSRRMSTWGKKQKKYWQLRMKKRKTKYKKKKNGYKHGYFSILTNIPQARPRSNEWISQKIIPPPPIFFPYFCACGPLYLCTSAEID